MLYNNRAKLGESPELFKETEKWVKAEMEKIEKNEQAREHVLSKIQPLLDKKKEKLIMSQE